MTCNFISRSIGENEYEVVLFPPLNIDKRAMRAFMQCRPEVDPMLIDDPKFVFGYVTYGEAMKMKRILKMHLACCNSPSHAVSYIEGNAEPLWIDPTDMARYFRETVQLEVAV